MNKKSARSAKWIEFMKDVAAAMRKQGITDAVIIFGLDGEIRNTYLPLGGSEVPLYCHISDAFDEWLRLGYTEPAKIKKQ